MSTLLWTCKLSVEAHGLIKYYFFSTKVCTSQRRICDFFSSPEFELISTSLYPFVWVRTHYYNFGPIFLAHNSLQFCAHFSGSEFIAIFCPYFCIRIYCNFLPIFLGHSLLQFCDHFSGLKFITTNLCPFYWNGSTFITKQFCPHFFSLGLEVITSFVPIFLRLQKNFKAHTNKTVASISKSQCQSKANSHTLVPTNHIKQNSQNTAVFLFVLLFLIWHVNMHKVKLTCVETCEC